MPHDPLFQKSLVATVVAPIRATNRIPSCSCITGLRCHHAILSLCRWCPGTGCMRQCLLDTCIRHATWYADPLTLDHVDSIVIQYYKIELVIHYSSRHVSCDHATFLLLMPLPLPDACGVPAGHAHASPYKQRSPAAAHSLLWSADKDDHCQRIGQHCL